MRFPNVVLADTCAAKPLRKTDRRKAVRGRGAEPLPATDIAMDHCLANENAVLMLDGNGMICDCNRAGEALFGYRRSEMVWRHVSLLLPQLAATELIQNGEPNPRLRYLCRIGCQFQLQTKNGEHLAGDLFLNLLANGNGERLTLIVRPTAPAAGGNASESSNPQPEA